MDKIIRSGAVQGNRKITTLRANKSDSVEVPETKTDFSLPEHTDVQEISAVAIDPEQLQLELVALQEKYLQLEKEYSEATVELEKIQQSEYSKAYDEGFAQGKNDARQAHDGLLQELQSKVALFTDNIESQFSNLDEFISQVSFAALCQLIGKKVGSELFSMGLVKETVSKIKSQTVINIHVNPEDYEFIEKYKDEILLQGKQHTLEVVADPYVKMGGCLVETSSGSWDGRLETQLQLLKETILSLSE